LLLNFLYAWEKHGTLPFPGSLSEQPSAFMQAVEAWDAAPGIFARQGEKTRKLLKGMGAYNGRK